MQDPTKPTTEQVALAVLPILLQVAWAGAAANTPKQLQELSLGCILQAFQLGMTFQQIAELHASGALDDILAKLNEDVA